MSASVWNDRAQAYFRIKEYPKAIADCIAAISLDSANVKVNCFWHYLLTIGTQSKR